MDPAELTPFHPLPEDTDALTSRVWEWGPQGEGAYARHVRLLPDGRVAGNLSTNESGWRLRGGSMTFLDQFDISSATFERAFTDAEGRWVLLAPTHAPGGRPHTLREVAPVGGLAVAGEGMDPAWRGEAPRRRNLVVLRANEQSLHTGWPRTIPAEDRTWDLCLSWYGARRDAPPDDWSEGWVQQPALRKYPAIHQLLHEASPLWAYDYVAFPDDDLMITWRDWNQMFAVCREHRLDLAQPGLSPLGHVTHPITARDVRYVLRYTSFVESMTPAFSRAALRLCAPTFEKAVAGFGLDNVWPKLIGGAGVRNRIAIVDDIQAIHTRPVGVAYDLQAAIAEGNDLQWRYDAPSAVLEYGGVLKKPIDSQMV